MMCVDYGVKEYRNYEPDCSSKYELNDIPINAKFVARCRAYA
jgi:hypothetical protein